MFKVTVGSRNRITVPYNCWMNVSGMRTLTMKFPSGLINEWEPGVGMTSNMSYRVAVPFEIGTKLKLVPSKKYIKVVKY